MPNSGLLQVDNDTQLYCTQTIVTKNNNYLIIILRSHDSKKYSDLLKLL